MKNNNVRWILIGLLVIAGIYLIADHGQHIAPYFPFVFLLGCLFMHLFGHGGHGRHDSHEKHQHGDAKQ